MGATKATLIGGEISEERYTHLEDDAPIEGDRCSVSLRRFIADASNLTSKGVVPRLVGTDSLEDLLPHLDGVSTIVVEFPKFADGRGYSFARLLRDRHGYTGELRASGDILRDQLFYLLRCGFDAFELAEGVDPDSAVKAFEDFSVVYQTAADAEKPVYLR